MSENNSIRWEDYIVEGARAQEAADYMEAFANTVVFDPADRLYPGEDYLGIIGDKVPEVEKEFGVTFTISF